MLGPIIIGYVTGRKAGDPVKGVIAMLIPIGLYFFVIKAIAMGWVHVPHAIGVYFHSASSASLLPYMNQTFATGMEVGNNIMAHLYYVPSSFFIMVAFAFIGGAMSRQIMLEKNISPNYKRAKTKNRKRVNNTSVANKLTVNRASKNLRTSSRNNKRATARRDGKFVVHEMDNRKTIPVKKKRSITFL